jgi:hypothetical protein
MTLDQQNAIDDHDDNQKRIKARRIAADLMKNPDLCDALAYYIQGDTNELDVLILEIKEQKQ